MSTSASIPQDLRGLRSCLMCSLVKSIQQFIEDGCDNCEDNLRMRKSKERVQQCTSPSFSGIVALMSPTDSWVARWQKIDNLLPGIYAISVAGDLPDHITHHLKMRRIPYRSRDTSTRWNK